MSDPPSDAVLENWHRYFAVKANNQGWDLAERVRTPSEDAQLLNAAHAAALHWEAVGTERHQAMATLLLAQVHAQLQNARLAHYYAKATADYFLSNESDDWEIALAHCVVAHAAAVNGDDAAHRHAYQAASAAIDGIDDADTKTIVLATFNVVPAPD